MSNLPFNPLPSFVRRNPHLYPALEGKAPAHISPTIELLTLPIAEQKLNKTERRYLAWLRCLGDQWIGIQCITLKIADDCRFNPDFAAMDESGFRLIDTKAFAKKRGKPLIEDDALVKIKCAAKAFPMFRFLLAWEEDRVWVHREVKG